LLQGTKAYGAHARALPIPAREDRDEFRAIPNFYWNQEDYLRAKQVGRPWRFTILRPQIIFGLSIGGAMNLIPAIGTYAALANERGDPLRYPGGAAPIMEAVDADLLAAAIAWCAETPSAAGEVFNVTNGDVFQWESVWPAIADALGMQVGEPVSQRLGDTLPDCNAQWDAICQRHGLTAPALLEFVGESFHYADFCMATGAQKAPPPAIVSTTKIRQAGFAESMDTEAMFRKWLRVFQEMKLLPPRADR
jgi:nucleoside-diphosphate-sugar epimerase